MQFIFVIIAVTHSFCCSIILILILQYFHLLYKTQNILHLWLWTFLAVILHVLLIFLIAYGTFALRPFSHKWVALGVINASSFIFGLLVRHTVSALVRSRFHPSIKYAIITGYYILRFAVQRAVRQAVHHTIKMSVTSRRAPTIAFSVAVNATKYLIM